MEDKSLAVFPIGQGPKWATVPKRKEGIFKIEVFPGVVIV